ncbi:MAG: hypothetical protein ACYCOU_18385 [Sulfobacillus sp.]
MVGLIVVGSALISSVAYASANTTTPSPHHAAIVIAKTCHNSERALYAENSIKFAAPPTLCTSAVSSGGAFNAALVYHDYSKKLQMQE